MQPESAVEVYNKLLQSHKRLPLDAQQRLQAGETVTIFSGTHSDWTSKLELRIHNGVCTATMIVNDAVPPRMRDSLLQKQQAFHDSMAE